MAAADSALDLYDPASCALGFGRLYPDLPARPLARDRRPGVGRRGDNLPALCVECAGMECSPRAPPGVLFALGQRPQPDSGQGSAPECGGTAVHLGCAACATAHRVPGCFLQPGDFLCRKASGSFGPRVYLCLEGGLAEHGKLPVLVSCVRGPAIGGRVLPSSARAAVWRPPC